MVTVNSSTKTEYTYGTQNGGANGVEQNSPNSVYESMPQNGVENQNTSKLDELLKKVCENEKLKKFNIDPNELKNSGILFRITGMNENQLKAATEDQLNKAMEALQTALIDSIGSDGKYDLEKVGKLANNYYIALNTGWSIKGLKEHNQKNNEDISSRMERFFGLKKDFTSYSKDEIKTYLKRYFDGFFKEKIAKGMAPEEAYLLQLQDFSKLLINTGDEDKSVLKEAIKELASTNKHPALQSVLASFDTPEARTDWANSWTVEDIKEVALQPDVEGNYVSAKDVTNMTTELTRVQSKEVIKENQEKLQQEAVDFFEKNKEALETLDKKIAEAKEKGVEPELTEKEQELLRIRENFIEAAKAGELAGTALNMNFGTEDKLELLNKMTTDAFSISEDLYKDILANVNEFAKNSAELTKNLENETAFKSLLNQATNGDYKKVETSSTEPLTGPVKTTPEVTTNNATTEIFNSSTSESSYLEALTKQNEKLAIIRNQSIQNEQIVVEARDEESIDFTTVPRGKKEEKREWFKQLISKTLDNDALKEVEQNFSKFSSWQKFQFKMALNHISDKKMLLNALSMLGDNVVLACYSKLDLTVEDIDKLNISIGVKQLIKNSLQEKQN